MANIKLLFQKELSVDLNTYYPSFPKRLREEIDQAVFALVSGDKAPKIIGGRGNREWSKDGDGFNLTHPARKFNLGVPPAKGKLLTMFYLLKDHFRNEQFTTQELKEFLYQHGIPEKKASIVITNLWRVKSLQVTKVV